MRKYYFRVDVSHEIGSAHLLRAIRLAKDLEVKRLGVQITFVLRFYTPELLDNLKFKVAVIGSEIDIVSLLGENDVVFYDISHRQIIEDLNSIKKVFDYLSDKSIKTVMYDGTTIKDSLSMNAKLSPDFLVVPYINIDKSQYLFGQKTIFLSGIKYFVFDKELLKIMNEKLSTENYVLISFGGSDVSSITLKVIEYLRNSDYNLKVVYSENFSDQDIKSISLLKSSNIDVYKKPKEFFRMLKKASLLITSTGLTKYEALLLSTPVLVISDKNYMKTEHEKLNSYGFSYIGNLDKDDICQKVKQLLINKKMPYGFDTNHLKDIFAYV